ncbi:MAG TPA: hypothetical protein VMN57_05730 [Anaerolineales bacterium]|nr:hypothetical protein [Anaerolineales bacterium]
MPTRDPHKRNIVSKEASRIARDSVFFEKVVPALLIGMAVLTVVLIFIAVGILVGMVNF